MNASERPTLLDRALRVLADVRAGEGAAALLLSGNALLLMTGYYLLKVVREGLLLSRFPPEVKVYVSAGQAVLLIVAIELYARVAARVGRRRLLTGTLLFAASNLALFFLLGRAGVDVGVAFYVWVGVFNVFVIAQFWSLANDVYEAGAGARLFPVLGIGAAIGSTFGSKLATWLRDPLGPYAIMVVAAVLLLVYLAGALAAEARAGSPAEREATLDRRDAFVMVARDRYLRLIALMMPLLNWVNTTGEYVLDKVMKAAGQAEVASIADEALREERLDAYIDVFRGNFFWAVNGTALLLQVLLVPRVLRRFGAGWALLAMPVVSLFGQLGMAASMTLMVVALAKIGENTLDYSLQNTARHALFLVTSRDAKYKAKEVIDAFLHRFGDVLAGAFVFVGTTYLGMTPRGFVLVNVLIVLVWLALAVAIAKEHAVRVKDVARA